MIKKVDRSLVFSCLRLIIFCIIISHANGHIENLNGYFHNQIMPLAKSGLGFAVPVSSRAESTVSDFLTFYAAGLLNKDRLENSLQLDVYNPVLFTQAINRVIAPLKAQGTYCLQYPPTFFALITPLAYFKLYTAWRIWFFASVISIIIAYIFIAYDSLKNRPLLLCGLLIALTTFPVTQIFFIGQTSGIEMALIALSFRFLIDRKYFWAGIIAALSLLKMQQMLIILIPGFCMGKKDFLKGVLLMAAFEAMLSVVVIGNSNVLNFLRINYMAEVLHSFSDGNDVWLYVTFRGMLQCLPWFISTADKIAGAAYILVFLALCVLWLKVFPPFQKISSQSVQLTASLSSIALIIFSLHGYWFDSAFYIIPCLWLYIWSTSDNEDYTMRQAIVRFIISLIVFYVPFFFWDNLVWSSVADNTVTWYQINIFCLGMLLLCCAVIALILEFRKCLRLSSQNIGSMP